MNEQERQAAHAARKAAVEALNASAHYPTPKVINGAGWVHEPTPGVRVGQWYCVRGGALGHELGQRVKDATEVENDRRMPKRGNLAGVFEQRLAWGARRTQPSESAIREAERMGWSQPYPLADLFQRERELRAAGLEA